MPTRPYETNGQYFAQYLFDRHLSGRRTDEWRGIADALQATNRASEWIEAFQQMTQLQLARRLIQAGARMLDVHGVSGAERETKQMILETMSIHHDDVADIYQRLVPAIRSRNSHIGNGARREITAFAEREMTWCYLCGIEMDFGANGHNEFTIDHVWPRAYGGDSVPENLLGACRSCNNAKSDTPAWAMYPIQSMIAGHQLSTAQGLSRETKLAVRARQAEQFSRSANISLRDSYVRLGPPNPATTSGESIAADFFALAAA